MSRRAGGRQAPGNEILQRHLPTHLPAADSQQLDPSQLNPAPHEETISLLAGIFSFKTIPSAARNRDGVAGPRADQLPGYSQSVPPPDPTGVSDLSSE